MSSNAKIPKFDSQIEFIRYSLANNIDTKTKFIQFLGKATISLLKYTCINDKIDVHG